MRKRRSVLSWNHDESLPNDIVDNTTTRFYKYSSLELLYKQPPIESAKLLSARVGARALGGWQVDSKPLAKRPSLSSFSMHSVGLSNLHSGLNFPSKNIGLFVCFHSRLGGLRSREILRPITYTYGFSFPR